MNTLSWSAAMVSNAPDLETAAIRNYWEHRLVRAALVETSRRQPIRTAYEIGAGYGRLSCVLREFAAQVVVFERDRGLLMKGQGLNPEVNFVPIQHVGRIPAQDSSAQFAMTFTVLQH